MKDHKHLQYCLYQIEQKLDWGESQSWKETEFLRLSEIISKETEISISPHTLKRLYGKIKYKEHYNPQRATKNALAKFIGYTDWIAFTTYYNDKIDNEPQQEKLLLRKKKFKIVILVLAGIALILLVWQGIRMNNTIIDGEQKISLSFDTTDSIAPVPYTVSVEYNIENVPSDSVYLDFNFEHPITGPEIKKLDKQRSLYNYTYQIPGYYHISLYSNGRELAGKNVLATSENWDSYFFPEAKPGLWLDNQIQASGEEGYLYYSPEGIVEDGFDISSVFYIDHHFYKNFEIDGDNFEMKVKFKNSKETGGITCYDFLTNLFCEKNFINFTLMETGCSGYSELKVGDTKVTGIEDNLSSFTFEPDDWNIFHVVVKEKKVCAYINNELIYSDRYQGVNGKIVGIEHKFKGTGMLDYVHLKDLGTQKEFFDDF